MNDNAVVDAVEAIGASVSSLAALARRGTGGPVQTGADAGLNRADPLQDRADAYVEGLAEAAKLEARVAALKVLFADGFASTVADLAPPDASRQAQAAVQVSVTAEVACVLTVSEGAAARFLAESARLSTDLPLTLAALQAGTVSWQHARVMCDETDGLDPAAAAALEAHFLDPDAPSPARGCPAGELTPGRFRAKARYWRERHHPVGIEARHAKCVKDRRLEYTPDRDGMAWLSAYLPADQAAGIWDRTTAAARALQGPTESRTLTQLRVDAAAAWLLGPAPGVGGPTDDPAAQFIPTSLLPTDSLPARSSPPDPLPGDSAGAIDVPSRSALAGDVPASGLQPDGVPSPTAQVLVTVPVFSLLGLSEEPATLDGYGPIPPSMARRLVADGATSFLRVLTDPRDGAPLEIGRTSYRLTKPMRQWLRLRDAKCTFPNCNNHSLDNDADHILAWADGGGTGAANLGQPCPKHHRLKHTTAWRPVGATRDTPPGWISPKGRSYPAEYQDWEQPTWPEPPPGQDRLELPRGQDSPGSAPAQDGPEPPDRPELPDRLNGFDSYPGPGGYQSPEPSEPPDDPDDIESLMAFDGPEPPLPADPWPYWSSSTAA